VHVFFPDGYFERVHVKYSDKVRVWGVTYRIKEAHLEIDAVIGRPHGLLGWAGHLLLFLYTLFLAPTHTKFHHDPTSQI
jgi:hypothetical protein